MIAERFLRVNPESESTEIEQNRESELCFVSKILNSKFVPPPEEIGPIRHWLCLSHRKSCIIWDLLTFQALAESTEATV